MNRMPHDPHESAVGVSANTEATEEHGGRTGGLAKAHGLTSASSVFTESVVALGKRGCMS
jgi:hypothetical protein